MKIIWLLGLSIYPVSYILTVVIKLIEGKGIIFEPPASFPAWLILIFLDSLLNRFGTSLTKLNAFASSFFHLFFVVILTSINTICFVVIISLLPKDWRPIAIVILYILLVAINTYIPEINL